MSKRYPGGIIRKTPQTPSQTSAQGIWDMASVTQAVKENTWPIAGVPDPISKSLRFRQSASAYLSRTPASNGTRTTWTWSAWVKRGTLGSQVWLLGAGGTSNPREGLNFDSNNNLNVASNTGGSPIYELISSATYRDPSAWYHIVYVFDSTQATSSNRIKLYVNGVQITAFGTATYPSQNTNAQFINSTSTQIIGGLPNTGIFDGYMTEVYFIDGQALTPSSFGNTNDQTGVWQPIAYTGTYGTNGFYLPFSNTASTSTLGNDFSGNSNNWTTNNISLTTGTSIQTFSTTGTTSWTAPTGVTSVNYLVVAGGGGGAYAGGGGAGGMRTGTLTVVPGASYTVTVGAGGTGGTGFTDNATQGSDSVFGSITSTGGGAGNFSYSAIAAKNSGGSGGGGGIGTTSSGSGTSGQGNAGGVGDASNAGGGGGAGAAGGNASGSFSGNGGAGLASSISGSSVTYAGGGGGGCSSNSNTNFGSGGSGGGGSSSTLNGVSGTANTGGGGGGASYNGSSFGNGGAGGSGIVILSWSSGSASTYDSMTDVPTQWIPYNIAGDTGALWRGNYSVLNPISNLGNGTISGGNLNFIANSFGWVSAAGTIFVSSGKWYYEVILTTFNSGPGAMIGVCNTGFTAFNSYAGSTANSWSVQASASTTNKWNNNSSTLLATEASAVGDVFMLAYDVDAAKVWFGRNGTWYGSGDPATGANAAFTNLTGSLGVVVSSISTTSAVAVNCGQRPFTYAPPSGFKTLNTTNLPTPTIGTTSTTQAVDYFDATTYTGTGSSQLISNSGSFQPNFVWIKQRSAAGQHNLMDVLRTGTRLRTDDTAAESDSSTLFSFASTGFNVLTSNASYNASAGTYVAWQWKASNSGVSNTAGSITSTVSANTTAGFSIVTFTGNATAGATVGHGLGVAPQMMFVKSRNNTYNWCVYAKAANSGNGQNGGFYLNLTDAWFSDSGFWNNTTAGASTFTLGSGFAVNGSGATFVAYCFTPVAGYSAFGSYTGNGSSDGPFVYTNFQPAFVMVKRTDTTGNWFIVDNKRLGYNGGTRNLYPNLSNAEATLELDLISNGFKWRLSGADVNASGGTYIYMAVAQNPFKFSLAQ